MNDIGFPNLGLLFKNVGEGITIFGFEIKFYGMLIATGFILGYFAAQQEAKRTGQNPENYLDYLLYVIIPAIVGARLYYVIFRWEEYFQKGQSVKDTVLGVINTRNGGLAVYGGIIAAAIVLFIFTKKRKLIFWQFADTATMGLLIGQIFGRLGNFFNREVFGGYTNSLFAMGIPVEYFETNGTLRSMQLRGWITDEMMANIQNGMIMVHPTFLYEIMWNMMVLLLVFLTRKHKKFHGQLFATYLIGYGIGRFWIEAVRTDTLMLPGIPIKASQLVSVLCILGGILLIIIGGRKWRIEEQIAKTTISGDDNNENN